MLLFSNHTTMQITVDSGICGVYYKGVEKAYAIIREESGAHFDLAVVEAFFAVTEDMEEREKLNKMT